MFYYEGQFCPVCGKAFAENDDIVSCPECGAPHHRACWMTEGHCHFADRHGTPEQWKRAEEGEKKTVDETPKTEPSDGTACPHCGKQNPTYAEFCSRCGRPLKVREWSAPHQNGPASYTPFRAPTPPVSESVPREEAMDDDGITAGEAALAVAVNQRYYLPRFRRIYQNNKPISWNWSAFLFPSPWLFFRKCYLAGALVLFLELAFLSTINLLLIQPLMQLPQNVGYWEMIFQLAEIIPTPVLLIMHMKIGLHVFCGLFGNYMYRQSVLTRCRRLKSHFPEDYEARLPIEGGIAPILFALAFFVVEIFPQVIRNLFVYFMM